MPTEIPKHVDVVVIGSGIIGAAVAYNLAKEGVDVAIVERGDFCGEASGANVGLLTVSTKEPGLLLDLALRSMELYPNLSEILGNDIRFERTGGLAVATTPEQLDARYALTEAQIAFGLNVRHVTPEEILDIDPTQPETILGGAYCPDDALIYPFSVVAAYLEKATDLGMRFVARTEVTGVRVEDGRVRGVETSRGFISANHVVNAAGAWAGFVSEMAGINAPVVPVRGQIMLTERLKVADRPVVVGVEPSLRQTWAGNGIIGSTTEHAGHVKVNTLKTIRHYAQGLLKNYPHFANANIIRSWSGLRPGTPDEMPILGESKKVKGFVIATGAFRNGMLYGPAIGEVIAEEVLGKPHSINIEIASPERFEQPAATAGAPA